MWSSYFEVLKAKRYHFLLFFKGPSFPLLLRLVQNQSTQIFNYPKMKENLLLDLPRTCRFGLPQPLLPLSRLTHSRVFWFLLTLPLLHRLPPLPLSSAGREIWRGQWKGREKWWWNHQGWNGLVWWVLFFLLFPSSPTSFLLDLLRRAFLSSNPLLQSSHGDLFLYMQTSPQL